VCVCVCVCIYIYIYIYREPSRRNKGNGGQRALKHGNPSVLKYRGKREPTTTMCVRKPNVSRVKELIHDPDSLEVLPISGDIQRDWRDLS